MEAKKIKEKRKKKKKKKAWLFQITLESQVTQTKTCKKHTRQKTRTSEKQQRLTETEEAQALFRWTFRPGAPNFVLKDFQNQCSDPFQISLLIFFYLSFLWIFLVFASSKRRQNTLWYYCALHGSNWRGNCSYQISGWCRAVCIACEVYLHWDTNGPNSPDFEEIFFQIARFWW